MSGTPTRWDRTIYRGTDHAWRLRRVLKADGTPIIPTAAEAQIRLNTQSDEVWAQLDVAIDPATGWITLSLPAAATEGPEWDDRILGLWDVEVVTGGTRLRWAQGKVHVDHGVTQ